MDSVIKVDNRSHFSDAHGEIEPDILVFNDPASTLRGEDKQIEAAVNDLLKQLDK